MIKFFKLLVLINLVFFISSCSFKNTGGFFEDRLKELEVQIAKKNSKLVFAQRKEFREEISGSLQKTKLQSITNKNWLEKNFTSSNYIPNLEYENKKELVYKSKKVGKNKFDTSDLFFETLIFEGNIFFYDTSGSIYNFSVDNRKLVWKFNFYKKRYKEIPINIKLTISNENLVISDNLGYIYCLAINSGKLNWAKNYGVPFRSNVKIDDGDIFLLNQDNKFYSIKEENGEKNSSLETFRSSIKTKQETNVGLDTIKNNIYFLTSSGQLYSINYRTNNINWLTSISTSLDSGSDLFFSSPIIYKDDKIFFSSSAATYSINAKNGYINWEIPFSTYLRPIVSEHFMFLASKDGFLLNLDYETGKVIWSKSLYKTNDKLKEKKIGYIRSFLLASNQILVTTSKGFFLFIDYKNGKILSYTRASKAGFFSNPVLVDKKIYAIDNKMKVLIFN